MPFSCDGSLHQTLVQSEELPSDLRALNLIGASSFFLFFFLFNQGLPFKRANHQSNTRISYTETLWVKSAVSLLPLHKRPHTFQWRACPWISAQFSDLILVLWQHSGSRGLDGWTVVRRGGLVNQGRSKVSLGLFVLLISVLLEWWLIRRNVCRMWKPPV